MGYIEFKSKVGLKNEIVIPEYVKRNMKNGLMVNVKIYDEGTKEIDGEIVEVGRTFDENKKFWDNYEFQGVWNGE